MTKFSFYANMAFIVVFSCIGTWELMTERYVGMVLSILIVVWSVYDMHKEIKESLDEW